MARTRMQEVEFWEGLAAEAEAERKTYQRLVRSAARRRDKARDLARLHREFARLREEVDGGSERAQVRLWALTDAYIDGDDVTVRRLMSEVS